MEIKLNSKTILEKEFKSGLRGYNQEEVDLFLDDIIKDYHSYNKKIAELENENERLKMELAEAEKRPSANNTGATNYDLLKRISNLEKHVFGDKLSNFE